MRRTSMDIPISESYVSIKLSEIQARFIELMQEELTELKLDEAEVEKEGGDPYNRAR